MASKLLILCFLPLLAASQEEAQSKQLAKGAGIGKPVPEEHRKELKKLLDGKSAQEIAALRTQVNAAKAKAPVTASPSSGDNSVNSDKEVSDLQHQIELLKTQLAQKNAKKGQADKTATKGKESKVSLDPNRPGHYAGHAPSPARAVDAQGKARREPSAREAKEMVSDMKKDMDRMMHQMNPDGPHKGSFAEMVLIPGDQEFEMQLDGSMNSKAGFQLKADRTHAASRKHKGFKELSQSDYAAQFPDAQGDSRPSWMFNPYLGLCMLVIVGSIWWNGQFAARNGDMQSVSVPGFGEVKAEKLGLYAKGDKHDSEEYGDLLDAGYTGYGAGSMKPMRNVASSWVVKSGDDALL